VLLTQEGERGEIKCPAALLPKGAKEGDILRATFEPDPAATQKYRDEAQMLLKELWRE
jgi:hypothetical protein